MKRALYWGLPILFLGFLSPLYLNLDHSFRYLRLDTLQTDEQMHLEVVSGWIESGQYGRWGDPPFSPQLTTGPAVLVPIAVLYGLSPLTLGEAGRGVMLLFHILTLVFLFLIVTRGRRSTLDITLGVLAIGVFELLWRGQTSGKNYIYTVIGEGAAVFYLTAAYHFLSRKKHFLSGLLVALSVFSKPYFLLIWIGYLIFHWRIPRAIAGALAPFLLAFVWGWLELGFSGVIALISNYPMIMKATNGAGLPDLSGLSYFQFLASHVHSLEFHFSLRVLIASLIGFGFAFRLSVDSRFYRFLAYTMTAHFCWWFFLSPGSNGRYLLPALIPAWIIAIEQTLSIVRGKLGHLETPSLRPTYWPAYWASIVSLLPLIWISQQLFAKGECAFCLEEKLRSAWKFLPERPERIFHSVNRMMGHASILMSAPYKQEFASSIRPGWFVVGAEGADKRSDLLFRLQTKGCQAAYQIPGTASGFWRCPE